MTPQEFRKQWEEIQKESMRKDEERKRNTQRLSDWRKKWNNN